MKSEAFLKNPDNYLASMVKHMKYDSCFKIDGLDSSECADDCQKASESEFAKDCEKNNGLFKCCIRYYLRFYRLKIQIQIISPQYNRIKDDSKNLIS